MYASYESMYLWCTSVNCMIRPVGSYSWDSLIFRGQFVMANELHRKWPWDFRALWWFEVGGGGAVMPLTGSLDYLCSGGSDTCKFMIMFRDFPVHHAWFGLVIHHDPCNMVQQKTYFLWQAHGRQRPTVDGRHQLNWYVLPLFAGGYTVIHPRWFQDFWTINSIIRFHQQRWWWWSLLSHRAATCVVGKNWLCNMFFFGQKVHRKSPHVCRSIASNS